MFQFTLYFKIYFVFHVCVCIGLYVEAHGCRHPVEASQGFRSPGPRVTGD